MHTDRKPIHIIVNMLKFKFIWVWVMFLLNLFSRALEKYEKFIRCDAVHEKKIFYKYVVFTRIIYFCDENVQTKSDLAIFKFLSYGVCFFVK